jgi:hypothetical protein
VVLVVQQRKQQRLLGPGGRPLVGLEMPSCEPACVCARREQAGPVVGFFGVGSRVRPIGWRVRGQGLLVLRVGRAQLEIQSLLYGGVLLLPHFPSAAAHSPARASGQHDYSSTRPDTGCSMLRASQTAYLSKIDRRA